MDPFDEFAIELRLKVLKALSTFDELLRAVRASPVLLRTFLGNKTFIIKHFFKKELSPSLIQDGVAIVTFPRPPPTNKNQRIWLVNSHLRLWAQKELPDPTEPTNPNEEAMLMVWAVYRMMIVYIRDYLSKATSPDQRLAFRHIPPWSHETLLHSARREREGLKYDTDVKKFDMRSLTTDQREKIIEAFFRYVILCKIFGHVDGEQRHLAITVEEWRNQVRPSTPVLPRTFKWEWKLLTDLEGKVPNTMGEKRLACVREYVTTLYGSLISDHVDAGLRALSKKTLQMARQGESQKVPQAKTLFKMPYYDARMPLYPGTSDWAEIIRPATPRRQERHETEDHGLHVLGPLAPGWPRVNAVTSAMSSTGFDLLTSNLTSSHQEEKLLHDLLKGFNRAYKIEMDYTHISSEAPFRSERFETRWHPTSFDRLSYQRAWPLFAQPGERRPPTFVPSELGNDSKAIKPFTFYNQDMGTIVEETDMTGRQEIVQLIANGRGHMTSPLLIGHMPPFWEKYEQNQEETSSGETSMSSSAQASREAVVETPSETSAYSSVNAILLTKKLLRD